MRQIYGPDLWNFKYLAGQGGDDGLGVNQGRVSEVVEAVAGEDLGTGLEPHGLTKVDAGVLGQELRSQAAEGAEHGPPGVDDLDSPVAARIIIYIIILLY